VKRDLPSFPTRTRTLLIAAVLLLLPSLLAAAEAVFAADGNRIWLATHQDGLVAYLDVSGSDGATHADRVIDVAQMGGPKTINGLAVSKSGNLLMAAPDAIWAFNPATEKVVRVAGLPAGFQAADLAYEHASGAILVWGVFLRDDHTVRRNAAYRIASGTNRSVPVLIDGIESWEAAAFDDDGTLFVGSGADLWGDVLTPTEDESGREFPWQIHAFRLAMIGTPVTGEGADETQTIHGVAAGGNTLLLTMRGPNGSTLVRMPRPPLTKRAPGVNRVTSMSERWSFQQKVLASAQLVTAADALPLLPLVAMSRDGARVVYQTAAAGVRRWWIMEKWAKARLLLEESD
jgi:hypothetical protein